jgi:hypothetical protein
MRTWPAGPNSTRRPGSIRSSQDGVHRHPIRRGNRRGRRQHTSISTQGPTMPLLGGHNRRGGNRDLHRERPVAMNPWHEMFRHMRMHPDMIARRHSLTACHRRRLERKRLRRPVQIPPKRTTSDLSLEERAIVMRRPVGRGPTFQAQDLADPPACETRQPVPGVDHVLIHPVRHLQCQVGTTALAPRSTPNRTEIFLLLRPAPVTRTRKRNQMRIYVLKPGQRRPREVGGDQPPRSTFKASNLVRTPQDTPRPIRSGIPGICEDILNKTDHIAIMNLWTPMLTVTITKVTIPTVLLLLFVPNRTRTPLVTRVMRTPVELLEPDKTLNPICTFQFFANSNHAYRYCSFLTALMLTLAR